jgi:hypothetical protein
LLKPSPPINEITLFVMGYSTSQFSVRLTKFPGITLVGTSPTFYKIKVTVELNGAVMGGMLPAYAVVIPHDFRITTVKG